MHLTGQFEGIISLQKKLIESFVKRLQHMMITYWEIKFLFFINMIAIFKIDLTSVKKIDYTFHAQFIDNSENPNDSTKATERTE